MKLAPSFAFFLLLNGALALADGPKQRHALTGNLVIRFDSSFTKRRLARTPVHKKVGTQVLYQSKYMPVDTVMPVAVNDRNNPSRLLALCRKYEMFPGVVKCSVQEKPWHDSNEVPCPTSNVLNSAVSGLAQDSLSAASNLNGCEIFSTVDDHKLLGGKLSPFWAQELIGSDLAKDEILSNPNSKDVSYASYEEIDLTQLDPKGMSSALASCRSNFQQPQCKALEIGKNEETTGQFDVHGNEVASLVSDPVVGAGAKAKLTVSAPDGSEALGTYQQNTDRIVDAKPQLLCSSLNTTPDEMNPSYKTLSDHGVVLVQSAGNDYPLKALSLDPSIPVVEVGSLSPTGLVSGFSSPGDGVTISAPSDDFIETKVNGKFDDFTGTSGAQPLVCGSVSNVISLLPGVTGQEIQEMLKKTAVPTLNSQENPQQDGAGMVNALKLVKVAEKLQSAWPGNRAQIEISDALYDFSADANDYLTKGQKLLSSSNKCDQEEGGKLIRSAFLLNPSLKAAQQALAALYNSQGFSMNAQFVQSLSGMNEQQTDALFNTKDSSVWGAALRYSDKFWPDSQQKLVSIASGNFLAAGLSGTMDHNDVDVVRAATVLVDHGQQQVALQSLVKAVQSTSDPDITGNLIYNIGYYLYPNAPQLPENIVHACFQSQGKVPGACVALAVGSPWGKGFGADGLSWVDQNFPKIDMDDYAQVVQTLQAADSPGQTILQKYLNGTALTPAEKSELKSVIQQQGAQQPTK